MHLSGCITLNTITIPNSVTTIDSCAFAHCTALAKIIIPEGVSTIGNTAFSATNITKISLPNSLTTMGSSVFAYCTNLESITIGTGLKKFKDFVFSNCNNLKTINYRGTESQWNSISKNQYMYGIDANGNGMSAPSDLVINYNYTE